MIETEQRRLRRTLRRVLLLACAAPASAFAACSEAASTAPAEAGLDAADAGAADAPGECAPSAPYFIDAGNVMIGDANCAYFVDFPCGSAFQGSGVGCYLASDDCMRVCTLDGAPIFECQYWPLLGCAGGTVDAPPGQPTRVACIVCSGAGRRPAGLVRARQLRPARDPLGDYFARAAHLEAASVYAFERLGRELEAHRAPRELVLAAERSARDEIRHARAMGRLARRFGAEAPPARVRGGGVRALSAIALENAVEGCVRETFGALVASWQAVHARDPQVRTTMRAIARDETRHAALAWAVARWAQARLEARVRDRIAKAARSAVVQLRRDVPVEVGSRFAREAGLPERAAARALVDGMSRTVWRA